MVGGAGVLLCACGLLYGGYWRIQNRKRFGLPEGQREGAAAAAEGRRDGRRRQEERGQQRRLRRS
ncbi:uncharacterized protein C2845_PM12G09430 [Panicum miliaceum]|uniref:Uncharacterized protein n=1 Tax=Panicum miliaceum TaxID=4540 RepID=A0A3L6QD20_PANMI|nr:uncharacterized protein C2845_PM12G09430 [Panicum miliaceum]